MDVVLYVYRPYLFLRTSQVWDIEKSGPTKEKENETHTIQKFVAHKLAP